MHDRRLRLYCRIYTELVSVVGLFYLGTLANSIWGSGRRMRNWAIVAERAMEILLFSSLALWLLGMAAVIVLMRRNQELSDLLVWTTLTAFLLFGLTITTIPPPIG